MIYYLIFTLFVYVLCIISWLYFCSCISDRKLIKNLLITSALPIFLWVFINPLYTQGPVLELSYRTVKPSDGTNWANSFNFNPDKILKPSDIHSLQDAVRNNLKVRVIGGGHSWSPLIETDDTLIDLSYFNHIHIFENYAIVGSGVTLQEFSDTLEKKQKMYRGAGSIKKQTIGGAFSTSLHGATTDGFSKHVNSLNAILANGTAMHVEDMNIWRDNMGLLGVMYEFNISIYALEYVDVIRGPQKYDYIENLMNQKAIFDATVLSSTTVSYDEIEFRTRVIIPHNSEKPIQHIPDQGRFIYYLYDSFLLPFLTLFSGALGAVNLSPLIMVDKDYKNVPLNNAWTHPAEYGFMASEYAIPIQNCRAAFKEFYEISPGTVSYEIRILEASGHCMSWAKVDSCAINAAPLNLNHWSDMNHDEFFRNIEKIAYKYNGSAHLGKHIAGPLNNQVQSLGCFDLFNKTRAQLDPTDKFVNSFAREYIYLKDRSEQRYTNKTARVVVFGMSSYIVILIILCARCFKKNERFTYSKLNTK